MYLPGCVNHFVIHWCKLFLLIFSLSCLDTVRQGWANSSPCGTCGCHNVFNGPQKHSGKPLNLKYPRNYHSKR